MKIHTACSLPGEVALLHAAVADFSENGARSQYSKWLTAQGDGARADTVRATLQAFHNLDLTPLNNLSGSTSWQRMIAVPLLTAFLEAAKDYEQTEMMQFRDLVFANLRPALSLSYRPAKTCLLYTSPSPRDRQKSRMPSSA